MRMMTLSIILFLGLSLSSPVVADDADCDKEFVCPKLSGSFADPCTCRRFYKCHGGSAHRSFCPSPLYWDDVKKFCTYKEEAKCGPIQEEDKKDKKPEETDPERASKCDKEACQLPFCYCSRSGTEAPIGNSQDLPQFILLTLDGAINNNNYHLFRDLFNVSDKIRATFFVENNYCDYFQVEQLYTEGHEIGLMSVRGGNLQEAPKEEWAREIRSLRNILQIYANVNPEDILGMRAPQAKPGFNAQFEALIEEGLVWDSSVSTEMPKKPIWPYTLDYRIPHRCKIKSCPTSAFPGVWELPLNSHFNDDQTGGICTYLDQCVFTYQTEDTVFNWIKEDFNRHYEDNRAPYFLSLHTNWFLTEHQRLGLKKFLEWTTQLPDVHHTTVTSFLLWITDPENLTSNRLSPYEPSVKAVRCVKPDTCETEYDFEGEGAAHFRYFRTCSECPVKYPWLEEEDS